MPPTVAYLAFGSNLGNRAASIEAAVILLEAAGVRVVARSPLFETDAVTPEPQPPFLNGAARVTTEQSAEGLLRLCLAVEKALGRERPAGRIQAPRSIDIDLLLFGDAIIDAPGLKVPHPRLAERPFARIPLAAVAAPGLRHPVTGIPLDEAAPDPGVRSFKNETPLDLHALRDPRRR